MAEHNGKKGHTLMELMEEVQAMFRRKGEIPTTKQAEFMNKLARLARTFTEEETERCGNIYEATPLGDQQYEDLIKEAESLK